MVPSTSGSSRTSNAAVFLAAAAVTGGRVHVPGGRSGRRRGGDAIRDILDDGCRRPSRPVGPSPSPAPDPPRSGHRPGESSELTPWWRPSVPSPTARVSSGASGTSEATRPIAWRSRARTQSPSVGTSRETDDGLQDPSSRLRGEMFRTWRRSSPGHGAAVPRPCRQGHRCRERRHRRQDPPQFPGCEGDAAAGPAASGERPARMTRMTSGSAPIRAGQATIEGPSPPRGPRSSASSWPLIGALHHLCRRPPGRARRHRDEVPGTGPQRSRRRGPWAGRRCQRKGRYPRPHRADRRARSTLRRTADDTDPVERVIVANADQLAVVTSLADPEPTAAADRPVPGRGIRRGT